VDDVTFSHNVPYGVYASGNTYANAVLEQPAINFKRNRQVAPRCLTLLAMTKSLAITTCGVLPLIGGLQREF